MPGFVGALGPTVRSATPPTWRSPRRTTRGHPRAINVRARGATIDLEIRFDVTSIVTTRTTEGPIARRLDFLQMHEGFG
jgi:hypothetical protein